MKYFIYTRKSTDSEERQVMSLESQLNELKEFAVKEKLEIVASLSEAQTAKEPIKNVGSNFMKARSGLFEFLLIKFILFGKVIVVKLISLSILV